MRRKEVNLAHPLRILDRWIRGAGGQGRLGVVLAPAGVGKSGFLVQLGLDALLRDRTVLHVAAGQSVDHVSAWYDAAFDELAARVDLVDRGGVREAIAHRRLIWSLSEGGLGAATLAEALAAFRTHLALGPDVILVDGLAWDAPDAADTLRAIRAGGGSAGAEAWLTARTAEAGRQPAAGAAVLPDACAALVDVALALVPEERVVRVRLLDPHGQQPAAELPLLLEAGTLRVAGHEGAPVHEARAPEGCTLLATGSAGAEAEFGACAERWGLDEVNYTFAGRQDVARRRGLVELGEEELRLGEVSDVYVKAHLHRTFPDTPEFHHLLQAIWHQVSTAAEVFCVGTLNPDNTVHGGTGWAVELARHWAKPVHLFEQDRGAWLRWDGHAWAAEPPPAITCGRFAGAGTRSLSEAGREAIRALFERSFGPPPT